METQLALLEKYGVPNYTIKNGKIIINGNLRLTSLIEDKDFLKGVTINGSLGLRLLTTCDKDFLLDTIINGDLDLRSLKTCDKDFLRGTTINGILYLMSLKRVDKDFLQNTKINGDLSLASLKTVDKDFLKGVVIKRSLDLSSLIEVDKDFLKETIINGNLHLDSLETCPEDFLKDFIINGNLCLDSFTSVNKSFLKGAVINGNIILTKLEKFDKDFLKDTTINDKILFKSFFYLNSLSLVEQETIQNNVKTLQIGYNKEKGYCYFDGILSKVVKVSTKKEYIIYTTSFDFVVQKGKFTAHGETVKKAIQDVEFKIISNKLRNEPITKDTKLTVMHYRLITGACDSGCRDWLSKNKIPFTIIDDKAVEVSPIKAKDLLPMLIKSNAYGIDKFKSLLTF